MEKKIFCEIEIAHMEGGVCKAIIYVPFNARQNNIRTVHGQSSIKNYLYNSYGLEISGEERKSNQNIEIRLVECLQWTGNYNQGFRFVFEVFNYSVEKQKNVEKQSGDYYFYISNLPIDKWYSQEVQANYVVSESKKELNKEAAQHALKEAISYLYTSSDTMENIVQRGQEAFKDFLNSNTILNASIKYPNRKIIFLSNNQIDVSLYFLRSNKTYETQPLAYIHIRLKSSSLDWSAINIADWLCNLLASTTGRRIIWNHYSFHSDNAVRPMLGHNKDYWRSMSQTKYQFTAFTEEFGILNNHGYKEYFVNEKPDRSVKFIIQALTTLLKKPFINTEKYLDLLNNYVYYISVTMDIYHKCILLCALGESLFKQWVYYELGGTFPTGKYSKQLSKLFEENGWNDTTTTGTADLNSLYKIGERVDLFVQSRNSLLHNHKFVYEGQPNKLAIEVHNIETFVPLMFATILGYEGRYWNKITDSWDYMPS